MHQLYNSDSLKGLIEMEDNTIDLALIDGPYFDYATRHRKKGHKFSESMVQQSREDQIKTIQECIRVLKPGSAFFLFTNWDNIYWLQQLFQSFFRNMIIWDKGNWTAGHLEGSLGNQYEIIFLGVKGKGWKHRGGRISDIWSIPRASQVTRIHATEKPVALYKKIIELSTDQGAWVVDPYAGSGSSVVAAICLGRNIIAWELDKYYHQKILGRLASSDT